MRAMVLAAGFGTRLRPLTEELPKPLVPIGDWPMLAHIADELGRAGIDEVVVNTHHLAAAFDARVRAALPLALRLSPEPVILGTAGGVANAAPLLGAGEVLVWGGDVLCAFEIGALLERHRALNAAATLLACPRRAGEGTLGLDAQSRVVRLRGECFGVEVSGADFAAIQVLSADLRRALPVPGCLVGDAYLPRLRAGARDVCAACLIERFSDVGDVAGYHAENMRWLAARGGASYVGPEARVGADVRLDASVVGAGAAIAGRGSIAACVVWPGAALSAPAERVIALPSGRLVHVTPGA